MNDDENKSCLRQFIFSLLGLIIMVAIYIGIALNRHSDEIAAIIQDETDEENIISTIYFYDMNDSMAGNYLSAKYAGNVNKFNQSAIYYQKGLESEPNNTDLLEKVFISHVLSGNIDDAILLISNYNAFSDNMLLAQMVTSIDKIKQGQYLEAENIILLAQS